MIKQSIKNQAEFTSLEIVVVVALTAAIATGGYFAVSNSSMLRPDVSALVSVSPSPSIAGNQLSITKARVENRRDMIKNGLGLND